LHSESRHGCAPFKLDTLSGGDYACSRALLKLNIAHGRDIADCCTFIDSKWHSACAGKCARTSFDASDGGALANAQGLTRRHGNA
jgi:hypothetical protein